MTDPLPPVYCKIYLTSNFQKQLKAFNPKVPRGNRVPMCNKDDIDLYMKMPINSPLVEPKVEMPLWICSEEDAILHPTST